MGRDETMEILGNYDTIIIGFGCEKSQRGNLPAGARMMED